MTRIVFKTFHFLGDLHVDITTFMDRRIMQIHGFGLAAQFNNSIDFVLYLLEIHGEILFLNQN